MKTVLVSAGHGAKDPGAISPGGRHREADLALRLRDRVAAILRARGLRVVEDGGDAENLPLSYALSLARSNPQAVKVEFHFNAGPPKATGVEALSTPRHKQLSQALVSAVCGATGLSARGDRGWKPDDAGRHHRLAFCQAGGVILEIAFISSDSDMVAYLANENRVAGAVATTLERFARA